MYYIFYHGCESPSPTSMCAGIETGDGINWPYHISGFLNIFLIIMTFIADVLMIILVRNLRKTQPIQLVPWKSPKNKDTEQNDISIPVRATSSSLAISIFTIVTVVVHVKIHRSFENVHWIFYLLMLIVKMFVYPFMLLFTIKHSKNKKPIPVIPNRPMFHDSELDKGIYLSLKIINLLSRKTYLLYF